MNNKDGALTQDTVCGRVGFLLSDKKKENFRIVDFEKVCSMRSALEGAPVLLESFNGRNSVDDFSQFRCIYKKLDFLGYATLDDLSFKTAGLELVEIDLENELEDQGPFDVIFMKITDILSNAESGNTDAVNKVFKIKTYIASHPQMTVVDTPDAAERVLNRCRQVSITQQYTEHANDQKFFIPLCAEVSEDMCAEDIKKIVIESKIKYPIICKCINPSLKQMVLVFNDAGLKEVVTPCFLQEFVNHNAVLYKVYCIGRDSFVVPRKSLRNFCSSVDASITFDSRNISKHASKPCDLNTLCPGEEMGLEAVKPDTNRLKALAKLIQSLCQLELMGIDVVIDSASGRHAVVDINIFPGYIGVPDVHAKICKLLKDKVKEARTKTGMTHF